MNPLETKVHFAKNFKGADSFYEELRALSYRVFFLSEEGVPLPLREEANKILLSKGFSVTSLVLTGGESSKSFTVLEEVIKCMIQNGIGKDACILCMGGGALSDAAGFLSSIYARGTPFASIPTTFLSMVDACIGGKTALNVGGRKNAIGTFYPPFSVLITRFALTSLSQKQMESGLAEVIKHSLILDKDLFHHIKNEKKLWDAKDPDFLEDLIGRSLRIKSFVLKNDPLEKGMRKILNFGHTIGHATESYMKYQISHGDAVAVGILTESRLSHKFGLLRREELDAASDLMRTYGFLREKVDFSYESLLPFMLSDKKNKGNEIRFVLLNKIGKAEEALGEYCSSVSKESLIDAVSWYSLLT